MQRGRGTAGHRRQRRPADGEPVERGLAAGPPGARPSGPDLGRLRQVGAHPRHRAGAAGRAHRPGRSRQARGRPSRATSRVLRARARRRPDRLSGSATPRTPPREGHNSPGSVTDKVTFRQQIIAGEGIGRSRGSGSPTRASAPLATASAQSRRPVASASQVRGVGLHDVRRRAPGVPRAWRRTGSAPNGGTRTSTLRPGAARGERGEALLDRGAQHRTVGGGPAVEPRLERRRGRVRSSRRSDRPTPGDVRDRPVERRAPASSPRRTAPAGCPPRPRAAPSRSSSPTSAISSASPPVVPSRSTGTPAARARAATASASAGATVTSTRPADSANSATNGSSSAGSATVAPRPPTRQASTRAWARPPSDRSCAPVSRPSGGRRGEQAGEPLLGGEVDRAAGGRRGARARRGPTRCRRARRGSSRAAARRRRRGRSRCGPGARRRRARRARPTTGVGRIAVEPVWL